MNLTAKEWQDKRTRLRKAYSIKDAASGRVIPFRPRPEQMEVFDALLAGMRKIIILKARRLGMSTGIGVFLADEAIFREGVQISIVDQTQTDASTKLNSIVKVAYVSLPDEIKSRIVTGADNSKAFEVGIPGHPMSTVFAGMNARGGTNQFLHASELGVIQADDPKRTEEIITGAFQSAEHGVIVVETTWKGGRGGMLWNIVKQALEIPDSERTLDDWYVFFFPWWNDPTYTREGDVRRIDPEVKKYLDEKEAETGAKFTDSQRCWYAKKRADLGVFIYREFPTVLEECFKAPIEGAIYADLIDALRSKGRIRPSEVDGSSLVHTFWDKGSPLNTVCWYVQFVAGEIRVIDLDLSTEDRPLDITPVQRVARMMSKGYPFGYHYLPHDAQQTATSGKTFQQELEEAGLSNTRVIPRTHDVWVGINHLRQIMPRMTFRIPACEHGLAALTNYHTRRESSSGIAQDQPVHDWSSHPADALRMLAEAEMAGMIQGGSSSAVPDDDWSRPAEVLR